MSHDPDLGWFPDFVSKEEERDLVAYLEALHPIWENRHPDRRPLRAGQQRRKLLRPVYWLGGWQFACLNYYQRKTPEHRTVAAEPFPPVLQGIVDRIEAAVHAQVPAEHIPEGWRLNTALINFYGLTRKDGRWVDTARVGGHRDHEPGPIGSISLGAPAYFQFVDRPRGPDDAGVVWEEWVPNRSALFFAGPRWKSELYHRVLRCRRQTTYSFDLQVEDFRCLRINFSLRHVPERHIERFADLPEPQRSDVRRYVEELAGHSEFFASALEEAAKPAE